MRPRKASKKPQYASAFTLFCDGKDFPTIAAQTGLEQAQIERCAVDQNWQTRRGRLLGANAVQAAEQRLQAQVRTDSTLVSATETAAATLAEAYVRLIQEASQLPTRPYAEPDGQKPTENELYRQSRSMIEAKAATMKIATSGLRELIETAQNVGLLKVERGGKTPDGSDDRDKPIDLAKLTQLNIAIVQATNGRPAAVLAQLAEPVTDAVDVTARQ